MNIQPIEIKIEDKKRFGQVAFLVDKPDFLTDIQDVRNQIKLSHLPYIFPDYPYREAKNIVQHYNRGLLTVNDVKTMLEDICREENLTNLYHLDKTVGTAVLYTESLMRKYRKNMLYFPVILSSILIGSISEFDFLSTQCVVLRQEDMKALNEETDLYGTKVAIFVNPESTPKEVLNVFDHIQKYVFRTKKTDSDDSFASLYQDDELGTYLPDLISNIKRDREWYWQHKNGMSYSQIWQQTDQKTVFSYKEVIIKAIKQYTKRLDMET